MRKRQNKKKLKKLKEEIPEQYEQEQESIVSSKNQKQGTRGTLSALTKKFIDLIMGSDNCTIDLKVAEKELKLTKKRRIYDITNVLEGINFIQKTQKNTYRWVGGNQELLIQRDIAELRKRSEEMKQKQDILDNTINDLNKFIREEFLDNQQMRQYHYITHEDMVNIYKTMSSEENSKSMIVISAPNGTSIEIGQAKKIGQVNSVQSVLKLDSKGKGKIQIFNCNAMGVQQMQVQNTTQ